MPDIAAGDIIELRLNGTLFGQRMINVFHYKTNAAPLVPGITAALPAFLGLISAAPFKTTFLACCPSDYKLDNMQAQRVAPDRTVFFERFEGLNGTGAAALPAQDANAVVTKRTAHIGNHTAGTYTFKGSTGSIHFPGLPSGAATAGLVDAAYRVTMGLFGTEVIATQTLLGDVSYIPVLWHRLAPLQPQSDDLIGTVQQPQVRVMRRREVGQGI